MKKTHLFLSSLLFLAVSTQSNAQTWGTGGINTWTPDNVGVGTTAVPTDASLRIDNYGGLTPPIPALKIDRYMPGVIFGPVPNQFEVWVHPPAPMCYPPSPCPTPPPVLVDVFDGNGWLGIQQAVPAAPIDVNGNGIIRNNLAVASNVSVGTVTPPVTPDASVTIHNSAYGSSPVPALKIDRYMPGVIFGPIPNHFEIWTHPAPPMCYPPSPCPAPPPVLLDEFDENGWLGINTPNPIAYLDVNGTAAIGGVPSIIPGDIMTLKNILGFYSPEDGPYQRAIHGNSDQGGLFMYSKSSHSNGSGVELWAAGGAHPGAIHFLCSGTGDEGFQFVRTSPSYKSYMNINKDGTVVIGGPSYNVESIPVPAGYALYVGTGILTEKVKVATVPGGNWSDFVFNDNYDLMPLNEVEAFVKANKHLPAIPSANDVEKDGVDMVTMDAKLLQKIEELTLYVIQQQKEIEALKKGMEAKKK